MLLTWLCDPGSLAFQGLSGCRTACDGFYALPNPRHLQALVCEKLPLIETTLNKVKSLHLWRLLKCLLHHSKLSAALSSFSKMSLLQQGLPCPYYSPLTSYLPTAASLLPPSLCPQSTFHLWTHWSLIKLQSHRSHGRGEVCVCCHSLRCSRGQHRKPRRCLLSG